MNSTDYALPQIDFRAELNDEQYAAATAPAGPALVLAGAGSGKTRTLTYRVAFLLSQGVAPWNILLLTFTNKAAREMLGRVEEITGVDKGKFWGGTFHSIGQRLLRMHGDRIGYGKNFSILDQGDAESLLNETMRGVDASFLKDKDNPKAKALYDIISYARNTLTDVSDVAAERYPYHSALKTKAVEFYLAYKNAKKQQQVFDYDDLLEYWHDILKLEDIAQECNRRFRYILVDEYQDTNTLQSAIIDKIGAHHNIMAVGDDAQCIYTWRGANFENIMDFPQRHAGANVYKIETNYRSSPEILRFANSCLENQPTHAGYQKTLIPTKKSNLPPMVVPVMDGVLESHFVINRITGLLDQGYQFKDIAILYRAHYQSMDMQMELSRLSIPYIITSGVRFFEQAHIRDLVAQLRFVNNPEDSVAFSRLICLLPRVGPRGADNLYKMATQLVAKRGGKLVDMLLDESLLKKVPADAKDDYKDLVYTLQNVNEAMFGVKKPVGQGDLFENNYNVEESDPLPADQVVKIAIDGWYGDFLRQIYPKNWQSRKDDLDSVIGFASRYDDMNQLLAELVLLNSETSDRSATETQQNCIRMTTVHQAKGLEFPVVFMIGMSQGMFPLKRAIEEGNIEEERRLFYVAVTRAQDELYLSTPRISAQGGPPTMLEPSQFISEIPSNHYEVLRSAHNRM